MRWIFIKDKLTGPITFDTTLADLISYIGEPTSKFKRTPDVEDVVYAYDNHGVHFNIDNNGAISQISVFPFNEFFIGEIQLLGQPIELIKEKILSTGETIEKEEAGLWFERVNMLLVDEDGAIDCVELYRN